MSRTVRDPQGPIIIATRSSELALRQAHQVQAALRDRGLDAELKTYKTVGDKRLDEPLSAIGAKGLFTKELEDDLVSGLVDCAVHSLKDLPTESPPGLVVGAVLRREDPRDALVFGPEIGTGAGLDALPHGARVGTSSLRRRAQLLALRPDLEVAELRGNVGTRLRKIDGGQVHAAILAAAGLHRLDAHDRVGAYLEPPEWLPAAGQGAIAVQIRAGDPRMAPVAESLDDAATSLAVRAERAFLAALEGGCQVPIGALAREHEGAMHLWGMLADVTGIRVLRGDIPVDPQAPETSGQTLARELRGRGAGEILAGLRDVKKVPSPQPE
jgi:hydroxymethylbilane synthase